ncbi:MAG: hypothetical protein LBM13_06480 [Candidatus Ancillula sp.]|jgi:hypothetical protein|nr:hypothetical protein [Candidatus Ancillula sp.]
MKIEKILELEAENYENGNNMVLPDGAIPTRVGHKYETISMEFDPEFAQTVRNVFGNNSEKIGKYFENLAKAQPVFA